MADKRAVENIGITVIEMIEVGIGPEKGRFPEIMTVIGVQAVVDQGQDLEQVQTGIE